MKKYDVLTAFDVCVDFLMHLGTTQPEFGQKEKLVDGYGLEMGGSACIFACQTAKLGLKTTGVGSVSDDNFGAFMRECLSTSGVDVTNLRLSTEKTALTLCLNKTNGDRGILTYMGAMDTVQAAWIEALLPQARHLHICSYFLLKSLQESYPALAKRAKEHGVTISLDTNWDPEEKWDGGVLELLPFVDVFLPNENELMCITGKNNVQDALKCAGEYVPIIAVKCGGDGAYAYCKGDIIKCEAKPVTVADTVGAGDSFNGGFIYGYLNGLSMEECLKAGTTCGSLNVSQHGGTAGQPTLAEIKNYL
ncbi:MAG: sugar kinase [Defluviitaleaceae bacterium]|nr:sugar kinase [Defluviitaleaceae bacterium]MCL2274367.1 sugar kinase [Defluviitaleaceae bacterium]